MDKETKNCKYCGVEIKNNLYCSEWCPKYRNKKKKDNFMNQTNNRIREEFDSEELEEIIRDVISGRLDSVHIHFFIRNLLNEQIGKIDELLKSQREDLVEKLEEYKLNYNPIGNDINKGRRLACDEILSLIKNN